jgi:hypothetical protein
MKRHAVVSVAPSGNVCDVPGSIPDLTTGYFHWVFSWKYSALPGKCPDVEIPTIRLQNFSSKPSLVARSLSFCFILSTELQ